MIFIARDRSIRFWFYVRVVLRFSFEMTSHFMVMVLSSFLSRRLFIWAEEILLKKFNLMVIWLRSFGELERIGVESWRVCENWRVWELKKRHVLPNRSNHWKAVASMRTHYVKLMNSKLWSDQTQCLPHSPTRTQIPFRMPLKACQENRFRWIAFRNRKRKQRRHRGKVQNAHVMSLFSIGLASSPKSTNISHFELPNRWEHRNTKYCCGFNQTVITPSSSWLRMDSMHLACWMCWNPSCDSI